MPVDDRAELADVDGLGVVRVGAGDRVPRAWSARSASAAAGAGVLRRGGRDLDGGLGGGRGLDGPADREAPGDVGASVVPVPSGEPAEALVLVAGEAGVAVGRPVSQPASSSSEATAVAVVRRANGSAPGYWSVFAQQIERRLPAVHSASWK